MSCNCSSTTLTAGVDGENAFTVTTASFVQPAVATNVTIPVSNAGQYTGIWAITGQIIFVESAGYFEVVSSTSTSIVAKYTASYTAYNQSLTAAGGTVATNKKVSPSGMIGTTGTNGTNGTTILYAYNDLTGVGNDNAVSESSLGSYTVTANTLNSNGDELDIDIYYEYTNNDLVIMRLKFGGSTIYSYEEIGALDTNNILNIKISRIAVGSQLWTITKQSGDATRVFYFGFVADTNSSATLSNSNLFEITADNQALGANQIVLKKLVIKKHAV